MGHSPSLKFQPDPPITKDYVFLQERIMNISSIPAVQSATDAAAAPASDAANVLVLKKALDI